MFAVPGWSVSSSALKTQKPDDPTARNVAANPQSSTPESTAISGQKRKRGHAKSKTPDVNPTNLPELWKTVIEQHEQPDKKSRKNGREKRQRRVKSDTDELKPVGSAGSRPEETAEQQSKGNLQAGKNTKNASTSKSETDGPGHASSVKIAELIPSAQRRAAAPQLTPLQASMRQKLVSARFRHLNQTLYTTPSAHSLELFQQNPDMFQEYHEGFRRQVEVWPENPVDGYIERIRQRGQKRTKPKRLETGEPKSSSTESIPLPRTEGVCHIADLGCGDAALSNGLEKEKKKLHLEISSFDLQSPNPLVTRADIRDLPLPDNSMDVAIFCLALMGTNWIDFIEEAFRVLRWKGELWVAEIKSRFGRVGGKGRVEHSVGNKKKQQDKKSLKKGESDANDAELTVAVDGNQDLKQETDVSAFVEVLRKRGFILQGDNAIDLDNRMFVRMSFVKGLTPVKGQHVPVPEGMVKMGLDTWSKKPKPKFVATEETAISSEASVLKPCVYKIR